jgi:O-antigen ligase
VIVWQPGFVYPPVFHPPHPPLDFISAAIFAIVLIAAVFVTVRRPANGIAALVLTIPFDYAHYAAGTSFTIPKAAFVGFVLALLWHRPSLRELRDVRIRPFVYALALMIGAMVLSFAFAEHRDAVAREIAKWLEYAVMFAGVCIAFLNDPDDRPIWGSLVVVTALVSVLSISQEFIGTSSGFFYHGTSYLPRISGPLEGPNQLAAWLGIALPILLARLMVHRSMPLAAVTFVAAVAEVLTISKSGITATIFACAVALLLALPAHAGRRRVSTWALVCGGLYVLGYLVLGLVTAGRETAQLDGLAPRPVLWQAALDLWRMSPIVGVGAGNYELDLGQVGLPLVHTHANSLYLQSLAELGVVGLIATFSMVYASIVTFGRAISRRPLIIGAFAASVGLALHQVFDYLIFYPKVGEFWWIVLAIGAVELINARGDARTAGVAA